MDNLLLVGSGWRARMWARLIGVLPDMRLAGVVCRNAQKRAPFEAAGIPICSAHEQAFVLGADATLVCVSKEDALPVSLFYREHGLRVLCETPAGQTAAERDMFSASDIAIAEQNPYNPVFRAARKIAESGALGELRALKLSWCHGCHAVALIRALLGTKERIPKVVAHAFSDVYVEYADRGGVRPPQEKACRRVIAHLDFGDRHALYDWSYGQYFSRVRGARFLLQGSRGELTERGGTVFRNGACVPFALHKVYDGQGGDLFAPDLAAIVCSGRPVYENPFRGLRLSEEEIAMAQCLTDFLHGRGYPAREGALDSRIAQSMAEAADGAL